MKRLTLIFLKTVLVNNMLHIGSEPNPPAPFPRWIGAGSAREGVLILPSPCRAPLREGRAWSRAADLCPPLRGTGRSIGERGRGRGLLQISNMYLTLNIFLKTEVFSDDIIQGFTLHIPFYIITEKLDCAARAML